MIGSFFKKKEKPEAEENKPFIFIGSPGQGMDAMDWPSIAKHYIEAATTTAKAEGKHVADLVAEGPDAFFAASEAAGMSPLDPGQAGKVRDSIFLEVVRMVGATKAAQD